MKRTLLLAVVMLTTATLACTDVFDFGNQAGTATANPGPQQFLRSLQRHPWRLKRLNDCLYTSLPQKAAIYRARLWAANRLSCQLRLSRS